MSVTMQTCSPMFRLKFKNPNAYDGASQFVPIGPSTCDVSAIIDLWTDGTDVYYSWSRDNSHILKNGVWERKVWDEANSHIGGRETWSDGVNTYYSYAGQNHVFKDGVWSPMEWKGEYTNFNGSEIWSDGTNLRFRWGTGYDTQYILKGDTWEKDLDGPHAYPDYVWTDGTNVYYSSGSEQLVLSKSTGKWVTKTWKGFTDITAKYIWTDGAHIYYSRSSKQYVLNGDTWEPRAWGGFQPDGNGIWTDGTRIFHGGTHVLLPKNAKLYFKKDSTNWVDMGQLSPQVSFSIDGVIFSADSNMTWHDWISSRYNTDPAYSIKGNMIESINGEKVLRTNGDPVLESDIIEGGVAYTHAIIFTVDNESYYSAKGMKWDAWINDTRYPIGDIYIDTYDSVEYMRTRSGGYIHYGYSPVLPTDVIISGATYTTESTIDTTITFTIDSISYTADTGMTWSAWIDSGYNTGSRYTSMEGEVYDTQAECYVCLPDGSHVATTAKITDGAEYILPV